MSFNPRILGARCDDCPLNGAQPVMPTGPEDAPIVFVGEAPGKWEVMKGRSFVGPSGAKLDELLYLAGYRRDEVRVTHAILCRTEAPGEVGKARFDVKKYMAWLRRENVLRKKAKHELLESPFDCCWPRLRRELWAADRHARNRGAPNGAVIMPLGNFALKQLAGVSSIMKYRGSVMQPELAVSPDAPREE